MITARGWHFVVRVQGQTRYIDCSGKSQRIDNLVTRQGQRTKLRGHAFKKHQRRDVSVVVYWGTRHQTPLCLVTSHPPKWRIILLYRRRFPIEAMFRDYKSYGWQFEQGQVTDLEHLERLLVGMALATWVTIYVGTQVAADHLSQPPTVVDELSPGLENGVYFAWDSPFFINCSMTPLSIHCDGNSLIGPLEIGNNRSIFIMPKLMSLLLLNSSTCPPLRTCLKSPKPS